jgi:virginiamycin B lyase
MRYSPFIRFFRILIVLVAALPFGAAAEVTSQAFELPAGGKYPHDVAVGRDGIVWYTAQRDGKLGRLDPARGKSSWWRSAPAPPLMA